MINNAAPTNLLAATVAVIPAATTVIPAQAGIQPPESPISQVYNVAPGDRTTLNELYAQLKTKLLPRYPTVQNAQRVYRDFRAGDVHHSQADICKAQALARLLHPPSASTKDGR